MPVGKKRKKIHETGDKDTKKPRGINMREKMKTDMKIAEDCAAKKKKW